MKTEALKSFQVVELSHSNQLEINGGLKLPTVYKIANDLYENGAAYWKKFKNGFLTGLK